MILSMENISKIYNGRTILDNVSLTIEDNDRIGNKRLRKINPAAHDHRQGGIRDPA